jgi:hypothetical protein
LARILNESSFLHEASKVLFVQTDSGQCFHHPLELQECKAAGKEFEDNGPILDLPSQSTHGGGKDPAMIQCHGSTQGRTAGFGKNLCGRA